MPLYLHKIRQNRGTPLVDIRAIRLYENHLAYGLYFVAKCDKIDDIVEVIFVACENHHKNPSPAWESPFIVLYDHLRGGKIPLLFYN